MAPKGFKQEMPPPGGYGGIEWAKKLPVKRLGGLTGFGLFGVFTGFWWVVYYYQRRWQALDELEMRDARIAVSPLLIAEQHRMMLKQFRANRDEENELMKNVEGWKTGTLWGEPTYHNIRNRWIWPATEEYFAHIDYLEKMYIVNDAMNH